MGKSVSVRMRSAYTQSKYHHRAHTYTHACTHVRTHARMHARTRTHTHARTHAHTHTNTHKAFFFKSSLFITGNHSITPFLPFYNLTSAVCVYVCMCVYAGVEVFTRAQAHPQIFFRWVGTEPARGTSTIRLLPKLA